MKPYHPANLVLQPYASWKVIALSWLAKAVGVQFHIQGIPFGASASASSADREVSSSQMFSASQR